MTEPQLFHVALKRIAVIEYCDKCPHGCGDPKRAFCELVGRMIGVPNYSQNIPIPDWCPLPRER